MSDDDARCKAKVFGGREGMWACPHSAKRDGYCNIHHPDAVKARREKSDERYRAQLAADTARWKRQEDAARKAAAYDSLYTLARDLAEYVANDPGSASGSELIARSRDAGLLPRREVTT